MAQMDFDILCSITIDRLNCEQTTYAFFQRISLHHRFVLVELGGALEVDAGWFLASPIVGVQFELRDMYANIVRDRLRLPRR